MSDFGSDFITVEGEDGEVLELEHLDTLEHEGETYMAFGVVGEDDNEDEVEVVIMHVVEQDGEEMFESVVDDTLQEEIYNLFMERIEEPEDIDE